MRIAVLSDTHIPARLSALPGFVYEACADCDLIIHAGDIEEPEVIDELSGSNVLVTEFMEGIKSDNKELMKQKGIDPELAATVMLESFAFQIFEYGFYHAAEKIRIGNSF